MSDPLFGSMRIIHSIIDRTKRLIRYPVGLRPLISISDDILKGKTRHIASKAGGLGDELMLLGVLQAAKRTHPRWNCVFHSRHFELLRDAPGLDSVVLFDPHATADRLELTYLSKYQYSLNEQMAAQLGFNPSDYRIELPRFPVPPEFTTQLKGSVTLVVQTDSSGWTPNKDWPVQHWKNFLESLPSDWAVFEVGRVSPLHSKPVHPRFQSFSGKTGLIEYATLIQQADCFVGPPSGGMHLAHAFKVPSVVIVGGYEAAHYPYSLARQLGSDLPCAPCWLRTPCPYDRKCLHEITPDRVLGEVLAQMKSENTDL